MELTRAERYALRGFAAQDQLIYHQYIEPLQREYAQFLDEVCDRLDLARGAIGTTHQVGEDGTVTARQSEAVAAAAE